MGVVGAGRPGERAGGRAGLIHDMGWDGWLAGMVD